MSLTTSYRPHDGRRVTSVADTTPEAVRAAVAEAAVAASELVTTAPAQRRTWLCSLADSLEKHSEELVALAEEESGLGTQRLTAELQRTAGQLRFYGDVAAEGSYLGVTIDHATETAPHLVRVNRPVGPVAVFGASNFPFAFSVLGNDTASALAAGVSTTGLTVPISANMGMTRSRSLTMRQSASPPACEPVNATASTSGERTSWVPAR